MNTAKGVTSTKQETFVRIRSGDNYNTSNRAINRSRSTSRTKATAGSKTNTNTHTAVHQTTKGSQRVTSTTSPQQHQRPQQRQQGQQNDTHQQQDQQGNIYYDQQSTTYHKQGSQTNSYQQQGQQQASHQIQHSSHSPRNYAGEHNIATGGSYSRMGTGGGQGANRQAGASPTNQMFDRVQTSTNGATTSTYGNSMNSNTFYSSNDIPANSPRRSPALATSSRVVTKTTTSYQSTQQADSDGQAGYNAYESGQIEGGDTSSTVRRRLIKIETSGGGLESGQLAMDFDHVRSISPIPGKNSRLFPKDSTAQTKQVLVKTTTGGGGEYANTAGGHSSSGTSTRTKKTLITTTTVREGTSGGQGLQ